MKIELGKATTGETCWIDLPTLVATRMLVTASSGGGKSETLRRILEEAVGHIQCIVIDPEGEFSTLREKKPFVLVGEGGETPADIRTAALVATRLLELNASAVCDIYEMRVHERHEWVKRFLDAIVHSPKALWHPVLVVLDEAHTYCPEHGYGESVASQSVIDLANLGRKRGFCAILATQRLSKLSKNAAEPLQNYLVGRTTFDDQKRAAQTFKIDPGAQTREFSLELERLKDGQFIARGRALSGDMLKVQVTRGETRPPKTGTAVAGVITPTPEAIKLLLPKLADLPHEAEKKAKTEEDLKRELADAKRRIGELERAAATAVDPRIERELARVTDELQTAHANLDEVQRISADVVRMTNGIIETAEAIEVAIGHRKIIVGKQPVPILPKLRLKPESEWPKPHVTNVPSVTSNGNLNGPKQAILDAVAIFNAANLPARISHIAGFCGTTARARGFEENMRQLKTADVVSVSNGIIQIENGVGTPATMASGMDALRQVLSDPQFRMLQYVQCSPGISIDSLADYMQTTVRARGFEENMRRLKSDDLLIANKDRLRVAEWLR
jgi:hypothetical protein